MREKAVRDALLLNEATNMTRVEKEIDVGSCPDLDDVELEEIGKDPFLIAAALSGPRRFVVTREVSKKTAKRGKARVPDVCSSLGITPMTDFQLYRKLAFSIA